MDTEIEPEPEPIEPGATVSAEEDGGVIEPISEDAAVTELGGLLEEQLRGDDETPKGSTPDGEGKPAAKGKKGKTSASQASKEAATAGEAPAGDEEEEEPAEPAPEPEPEPEPASAGATEDTIDLSKWDLPAETAAEIQESFNRAMSKKHRKLTREREQREQLEDQLGEVRQENETLKAGASAPSRGGAGLGTPFEVEIGTKVSELQQGIAFCDEHEGEGWTGTNSKGVEVTYTPEQLRASRRVYEKELVKAEIRLEDFQAERAGQSKRFDEAAITEHPWLKNANDQKTQTINKTLANFPVLREIPGMRLLLARALSFKPATSVGATAGTSVPATAPGGAGSGARPAGGAMKPPPKVTTRPGSAPAAQPAAAARQDAAWKALEKNPSDQAAVELLKTIVD